MDKMRTKMNVKLNRYKIEILFDRTYLRYFFAPTRRSLCKDALSPLPHFFWGDGGVCTQANSTTFEP